MIYFDLQTYLEHDINTLADLLIPYNIIVKEAFRIYHLGVGISIIMGGGAAIDNIWTYIMVGQ